MAKFVSFRQIKLSKVIEWGGARWDKIRREIACFSQFCVKIYFSSNLALLAIDFESDIICYLIQFLYPSFFYFAYFLSTISLAISMSRMA